MKNRQKYLGVLVLAIVAAMLAGCKKNSEVKVRELNPDSDWEILEAIFMSDDEGIPFPQGSKVRIDRNGTHIITLPEGYFYLVLPVNQRDMAHPIESPIIGVNCHCSEGSGCDPATANGKYYCVMKSGCMSCKKTNIYESQRGEPVEVEILGLLNRNVGISLLCEEHVIIPDADDLIIPPYIEGVEVIHGNAFEELFDIKDVQEEFEMLGNWFEEEGTPPNTFAFMNIYGNVALVPFYIPEGQAIYGYQDKDYFAMTAQPGPGGEPSFNCRCESGEDGCTLEKRWVPKLGNVYRCKSTGCSSCTMIKVPQQRM